MADAPGGCQVGMSRKDGDLNAGIGNCFQTPTLSARRGRPKLKFCRPGKLDEGELGRAINWEIEIQLPIET
jgi:hypothetical protein